MPEDFVSDEQIRQSTGGEFRAPPGVPKATCLNCGQEYWSSYAVQSHDCLVSLGEIRFYAEWLVFFQRLGFGVLKTQEDAKFPLDKKISARRALTNHLQSDLFTGPGYELIDWYQSWDEFPTMADDAELVRTPFVPRAHDPEFDKQPTPGIDRHRG